MNKVLERRLEFLKLEARGFSQCEIVQILSEKFHTSERNIYYDAETRDTWQPVLSQYFDLDKARLILINRLDFLYRTASLNFSLAKDPQKPAYFAKMVETTDRMITLLGVESLKETQDAERQKVYAENAMRKNEFLSGKQPETEQTTPKSE